MSVPPEKSKPFFQAKRPLLDERSKLPFSPHIFDELPMALGFSPMMWPGERLLRPTSTHGRSFELRYESPAFLLHRDPQYVFGDEYGNWYSSMTTKGNDLTHPSVMPYNIEPSQIRVNGLQDATVLRRIRIISRLLREAGVDTEWPVYAVKPFAFDLSQHDVPKGVLGFKRAVYKEYIEGEEAIRWANRHTLKDPQEVKEILKETDVGTVGAVAQALLGMEFMVTVRAMKTPYRLNDLAEMSPEDAREVMGHMIWLHNFEEGRRAKENPEYQPSFLNNNSEGWHEYVVTALPVRIGTNIAIMHNVELWHKYLHAGNITLFGGIVDLDSVQGQFNGDTMPADNEFLDDVLNSLQGGDRKNPESKWFQEAWNKLFANGIPHADEADKRRYEDWADFVSNLFDSYLVSREDFTVKPANAVFYRRQQVELYHRSDIERITPWVTERYERKLQSYISDEKNLERLLNGLVIAQCVPMFPKPGYKRRSAADESITTFCENQVYRACRNLLKTDSRWLIQAGAYSQDEAVDILQDIVAIAGKYLYALAIMKAREIKD